MSQRLISKRARGLVLSDLADLVLRGSDPEDGTDNDDQDGDGSGGTDGGTGSSDDGADEGKPKQDDKDAELEAIKARMRAADRRAAAAEAKVKEYEDKDKLEGQRLTEENEALKAQVSELQKQHRESVLHNAFLTANDYTWHDAEAALRLADLSEVMDEDGEVDRNALKKALKGLAESKPFLVKTQEQDAGDQGKGGGPSGSSTGSPKNKKQQGMSDADLARLYPALASRI